MALSSFSKLKEKTRVPNKYKKLIRNSKLSSFIFPNKNSYRVISKNSEHHSFIKKIPFLYSTSANENKKDFCNEFALEQSDVVIYTKDDFSMNNSSSIYKITNHKIKKIR